MSAYQYGGKELANAFRTVRKNTVQIAEDIPESSYDFVAAPEVRPVAHMLVHVAISTRIWEEVNKKRLTTLVGFDFLGTIERFHAEEVKPRSKAEIVNLLKSEGEQFAAWLETLTPEFLAETVTEADGKMVKTRFERLLGAKEHEMHHRAQVMLVERQLGIVPHVTRQFQERMAQMRAAQAQGASA
ncbi:MAG TPA: DinB family protein [Candidatus Eremiobacteraceae bacterium]|nr:DinB family protein [Candidatus Eremiobacteraceae bacterium]